ncbi:Magnesium-dependent phosphatase 1, partial [Bienertia sinuspersici]
MPSLYPDVKGILYALKDKGIDVAIASRSSTPEIAKTILDKLGIQSMFVAQRIHKKTKIPYADMLFFDDEHRNIIAL